MNNNKIDHTTLKEIHVPRFITAYCNLLIELELLPYDILIESCFDCWSHNRTTNVADLYVKKYQNVILMNEMIVPQLHFICQSMVQDNNNMTNNRSTKVKRQTPSA
ncbi:hypothetical protein HELRODRAFT_159350 [Helobdella robusta]|uniref:Uncharacterized protein n=1 Tax=Helobdella robusta TaxID=6412 RepID=T1ENX3_HELRO|nr:hypothetical protein HELRODRAFT_159350 [Helobdella robusta]ESO12767.1 hypothetical protein HELRODRAFT_159350 [Helobdella robusta]